RPNLLGTRRFSDLEPLLEIGVPQRGGILVVAMDDLCKRHTELVLVARDLDAVLDVRQGFAERIDAGQSARRALHEGSEIRTEQIEAGIGDPAEVARLERGARDDERAAEGTFMARLAVAVIRHELRAGGAHMILDVLIE